MRRPDAEASVTSEDVEDVLPEAEPGAPKGVLDLFTLAKSKRHCRWPIAKPARSLDSHTQSQLAENMPPVPGTDLVSQ